jgi:hypothetical protein
MYQSNVQYIAQPDAPGDGDDVDDDDDDDDRHRVFN